MKPFLTSLIRLKVQVNNVRQNQKGVSFVEVLASITLVSIIAVIGWTVLSTGSQHSMTETGKTHIQQDANLILTTLSNEHRKSDAYYIKFQSNEIEVKTCKESICGSFQKITTHQYDYTGTINGIDFSAWDETTKLEPEKSHVDVFLTVTDANNTAKTVSVATTLTRILTSSK